MSGPAEAVGPVGPGPDQKLSSNIYVDNDFSVSSACCLHWSSANTCVYVCIIFPLNISYLNQEILLKSKRNNFSFGPYQMISASAGPVCT